MTWDKKVILVDIYKRLFGILKRRRDDDENDNFYCRFDVYAGAGVPEHC